MHKEVLGKVPGLLHGVRLDGQQRGAILLLSGDNQGQLSPHIQELELDLREARYLGAILRGGLIEDEGSVDPVEGLGQSHVLQEVDNLGFGRLH